MNERLRELVRQAGLDDADFPIENWDNIPLSKFAELIVQECMKLNSKELSITAIERLLPMYREHFGVEE
jgi:hypothetical protein